MERVRLPGSSAVAQPPASASVSSTAAATSDSDVEGWCTHTDSTHASAPTLAYAYGASCEPGPSTSAPCERPPTTPAAMAMSRPHSTNGYDAGGTCAPLTGRPLSSSAAADSA